MQSSCLITAKARQGFIQIGNRWWMTGGPGLPPFSRTVFRELGCLCFCGQLLRQSAAKLVLLLFSGQFSSYEA